MNRILKHLSKKRRPGLENFFDGIDDPKPFPEFDIPGPERKAATDKIPGSPDSCSYCGKPLATSLFIAVSKDAYSAMCDECLEKFAPLVKMSRLYRLYLASSPSWDGVRKQIEKSVASEDGSTQAKQVAVDIALPLAKRASGIMGRRHAAMKKGLRPDSASLERSRIAIVGKGAANTVGILKAAMSSVGIPFQEAVKQELAANPMPSKAVLSLFQKCNCDDFLFENALMFVTDGYAPADVACSVVYACESEDGIPKEVAIYRLDEFWEMSHGQDK